MMTQVLSRFHIPFLTCLGLLLFLTIFLGALLWVFRKGSDEIYSAAGALPLEDERPTL